MNKTWKPTTSGILSIIAGFVGVIAGIVVAVLGEIIPMLHPMPEIGVALNLIATIMILLGIVAIVGAASMPSGGEYGGSLLLAQFAPLSVPGPSAPGFLGYQQSYLPPWVRASFDKARISSYMWRCTSALFSRRREAAGVSLLYVNTSWGKRTTVSLSVYTEEAQLKDELALHRNWTQRDWHLSDVLRNGCDAAADSHHCYFRHSEAISGEMLRLGDYITHGRGI
jgi:hypothetical protein